MTSASERQPVPAAAAAPSGGGSLEALYAQMWRIRRTEETLLELFAQGELSGTTHTSIGQEAIAVAVGANLTPGDVVFSSHRCHGHFLAYGGPLVELIAEIMGRQSALCDGRGGSQNLHWRDFYSSGVQGGAVGNATGMALAEQLAGSGRVVVSFLGDGTLGEGLVYESLNFASLRSLPVLYVLENNQYSQSTPARLGVSGSMLARAEAFGIAAAHTDSNDVLELCERFAACLAQVRGEGRPFVQIVETYRLAPHSKGDDDRDPAEIAAWARRDPLLLLRDRLGGERAETVERDVAEEVAAAVAQARERPYPSLVPGPHAQAERSRTPAKPPPVPWPDGERTTVQSLNDALHRLLEEEERAFVLGEDILDPYGGAFKVTRGLSARWPERVLPAPLSEAGIVAWATGAALRGARPVVEIMFGDFLALAADQLVNHASKHRWVFADAVEVPLVVRTPMGGRRGYGPTHSQSIESMFLGVPGLDIVAPPPLLDAGELLLRAVRETRDPVLFIENKLLYPRRQMPVRAGRSGRFFVRASDRLFPTLHLSLIDFQVPDAVLACYGGNVPVALDAATTLLLEHEVACDLVVPALVSPLPVKDLVAATGACPLVATLEEGPLEGGWGAEVIAVLAERQPVAGRRFVRVGAPAHPIPSSRALEEMTLPASGDVVTAVAGALGAT